ncbi:HNH endonuclease family protein [Staphylococcus chromogenes]|nr:HNH endonuclease family protein [Staphylococcus chromogenes]
MDSTRLFTAILTLITATYFTFTLVTGLPRTPAGLTEPPPLSSTLPYISGVSARPDVPGYSRERFGDGWAQSGTCTVRHDVMRAQLSAQLSDDCRHSSGSAEDPYRSALLSPDTPIEIDHVIPLSAAWDLGAHAWTDSDRARFANDPLNLIATSRELNQEKSDQLPSQWMPPRKSARCFYARRVAHVAATYSLPLPQADRLRMRQACLVRELVPMAIG